MIGKYNAKLGARTPQLPVSVFCGTRLCIVWNATKFAPKLVLGAAGALWYYIRDRHSTRGDKKNQTVNKSAHE